MRRLLIGVVLAAAGVLATPAAAWPHAELVASEPGYGDRLAAAPAEVRLRFSGAVDLTGARITIQRGAGALQALRPAHASPDRRVVSIALLPALAAGDYRLVWYFLGGDGHLMGGEVTFSVGVPAVEAPSPPVVARGAPGRAAPAPRAPGPGIPGPVLVAESAAPPALAAERPGFTIAVAAPQAVVRFVDYAGLAVLLGGGFFLARVWSEGTGERRVRRLLWWALIASLAATLLRFAFTAAGLQGAGALDALDPSVMSAVLGTRFSRVMAVRASFLAVAGVALAMLTLGRDRAVRSGWWQGLAALAGAGVVGTHALLGHVSNEGPAARLAAVVHITGVAIWLGGLVFLAAVVLPRGKAEEVRTLVARFSRLAFTAVSAVVLAGAVMMIRVVPELGELSQTGYGRMLLVKLLFVGLLLAAARQARTFTERRLVHGAVRLRPLVVAVGAELVLAVVILSSTSVVAGRVPPGTSDPPTAVSRLKGP